MSLASLKTSPMLRNYTTKELVRECCDSTDPLVLELSNRLEAFENYDISDFTYLEDLKHENGAQDKQITELNAEIEEYEKRVDELEEKISELEREAA